MVLGLGLFKWDYQLGVSLDVKYPEDLDLSENFVNKILMAHSIGVSEKTEDYVEMELEEKIIMSFWKMLPNSERGYEMLILLLQKKDYIQRNYFKTKFLKYAQEILKIPQGDQRKEFFLSYVYHLFFETKKGKVLLLGRAGSGKSSIKEVIFEGKEPQELLNNALLPTISFRPSVYSWFDLELGIFDTVGQRFDEYLKEGKNQVIAFSNVDVIIYLFDFSLWVNNNELIFNDIKEINEIITRECYYANFVLFFHKVDLIEEESREKKTREFQEKIEHQTGMKIYFTSIYPNLLYKLYFAFYDVLSALSVKSSIIKDILDEKIKPFSKTLFFITNEKNNIVVQSMAKDFDFKIINFMHNLIANVNQVFETMQANKAIKYFLLSTFDNFNINMKNLGLSDYGLKNIAGISSMLRPDHLIRFIDDLSDTIKKKLKDL